MTTSACSKNPCQSVPAICFGSFIGTISPYSHQRIFVMRDLGRNCHCTCIRSLCRSHYATRDDYYNLHCDASSLFYSQH